MKRERFDKAVRNEHQIVVAERNLAAADEKARRWKQRIDKLRQEQLAIRLERRLPLGRSTNKNRKKHLVWYAVQEILGEAPSGMTTAELFAAVREEQRRLNIITFRAYLREFCSPERRLIDNQSGRWVLAELVKLAQNGER